MGDCEDGQGEYKFKNGLYVGQFSSGLIDGDGMFTTKKGYSYNGSWEEDKKQGFGKEVLRKAGTYAGNFFHNQRHGYGEATLPGTKFMRDISYDGKWVNGAICGQGTLSYYREVKYGRTKVLEKNTLSGVFINGVLQGRLTEPYPDELLWESFSLKTDHFQKYQRLTEKEYKRAKNLATMEGDIFISCECSSGFLIFDTKAILRKELSWWSSAIPPKTKSTILNTMQREFDIIEWHARDLKNELNKEFLACELASLYTAWELLSLKTREAKQVRKTYSAETAWNPKKGIVKNKRPQEKWNGKIESKLRKYKKANTKTLVKLRKKISKKAKNDCDSLAIDLALLPQKRESKSVNEVVVAELKPMTPKQLAKKMKAENLQLKKDLAVKRKKEVRDKKNESKKRKETTKKELKQKKLEEKKAEEKKLRQLKIQKKEEQKIESEKRAKEKELKSLEKKARKEARKLKRSQRSFEPNFPRSKQLE